MPYVNVNGHRIHYVDTKDQSPSRGQDELPLIMVHGLGSSQNFYTSVIPYLESHRCIAFDNYGAARSKSHGEDLTLHQLADDIAGLLDALNITRAVLVGHSMGGPMTLVAAAHYPDKVAGVVALGPVKPGTIKAELFTSRIETVLKDGMEPMANAVPTAATNKHSTPLQRAFIRELILNQEPKSYASHCRVILDMQEPKGGFVAVKCPVLILAGDEDQSAPLSGCQGIHDELGSSKKELKIMKGVGHWHCIEAGDRVAAEIHAFAGSV